MKINFFLGIVQMIFDSALKYGWVFFLFMSAGCENPFATREPEPPEQGSSTFLNPSLPEVVFVNLQLAISERNVENYIRSFVDTTASDQIFEFIPDTGVAAANPGTFAGWNLENERLYLLQLFQAILGDSLSNLIFIEKTSPGGTDMAVSTQDYEIVIRHSRQLENIPVIFRGQSKFRLEKNETGNWAIYRWEDFSNGVDPSWSELKALFQ